MLRDLIERKKRKPEPVPAELEKITTPRGRKAIGYTDGKGEFNVVKWQPMEEATKTKRKTKPKERFTGEQVAALRDMLGRTEMPFVEWLQSDEAFVEIMHDAEALLEKFQSWLETVHGIRVDENGLVGFKILTPTTARIIGDLPIVLYHYTSSTVVPAIKRVGLHGNGKRVNRKSQGGVSLTTEDGGAAVDDYTGQAIAGHGRRGRPVRLSVRTKISQLRPDPDEIAVSSRRHQFAVSYVAPHNIVDVEKL